MGFILEEHSGLRSIIYTLYESIDKDKRNEYQNEFLKEMEEFRDK